jgi:hypothetical protein
VRGSRERRGPCAYLSTEKESTAAPSLVENTDALPMLTPSSESTAVIRPRLPRRSEKTSQMVARLPFSVAHARCTLVDAEGSASIAESSRACCTLSVYDVDRAYCDGSRWSRRCTPASLPEWTGADDEDPGDSSAMVGIEIDLAGILGLPPFSAIAEFI